jgi:hypothetical protein
MKQLLFFCSLLASATSIFSQSIAINTTGSAPDPSAQLHISSTSKGLLIPRMTIAERDGISNPANGLLVFQTNGSTGFYYNTGTPLSPSWKKMDNELPSSAIVLSESNNNPAFGTDYTNTGGGVMLTLKNGSAQANTWSSAYEGGAPVQVSSGYYNLYVNGKVYMATNDVTGTLTNMYIYTLSTDTWQFVQLSWPMGVRLHTDGVYIYSYNAGPRAGFRYNISSGIASAIPSYASLSSRLRLSVSEQFCGNKLVVWGGTNNIFSGPFFNDGAVYDVGTNTWSYIAANAALTGRSGAATAWTGTEVLFFGGTVSGSAAVFTGARYNLAGGTWATIAGNTDIYNIQSANWTGTEMLVNGSTFYRFNPVLNTWTLILGAGLSNDCWDGSSLWSFQEGMFGGVRKYDAALGTIQTITQASTSPFSLNTVLANAWCGDRFIVASALIPAGNTAIFYTSAVNNIARLSKTYYLFRKN